MKLFTYTKLTIALLSIVVLLNNCAKKGDPGPVGDQGTQGAGFDEAVKNGNILVYFDGVSPSGIPFKDTLDFKFSAGDPYYSSGRTTDEGWRFSLKRYQAFDTYVGEGSEDPSFSNSLELEIQGSDTTFWFEASAYCSVALPGFKYFSLYDGFYNTDGENFEDLQIDGLKFDATTGRLYYRFSFLAPAEENNSSAHDLKVSGVVDVTVYDNQ